MKKLIKFGLISCLLILLIGVVYGTRTLNYNTPGAYSTSISTDVNVSFTFSQTDDSNSETTFNATIYNKSSSSGSYGILVTDMNLINGTQNSTIVTLVDGDRHWLYINVSNVTGGPTISSERIIDVDTQYLLYQLGNFDTLNL